MSGPRDKTFKPQWAQFVAEYMRCGSSRKAAEASGMQPGAGPNLLKNKWVSQEIERLSKEIAEKGKYNLEKAMEEAQEGIDFAKATENANAYATLVIHRAKLHGLVIDKADHRISGNFQINIEGIDKPREVGPGSSADQTALTASEIVPQIVGQVGDKEDAGNLE